MRGLLVSMLIVLALAGVARAEGIDRVYEKAADSKSWGELLAEKIGYPGYAKSYALVIGISHFDHFSDLPTERDAIRFKDFLIEEAGFDYVHLLTEEQVTDDRIRELMRDVFPSLVGTRDRFLFYWSGHGITRTLPGGGTRGYLPLSTSRDGRFFDMVSMVDIQLWDDLLEAGQVAYLLDACFSGLAGSVPQSIPDYQRLRIDQLTQPSRHILTAGTADEQTIAIDRLGGSVFTTAVLDGLRGAADASSEFPNDGLVSLSELKSYVNERILHERTREGWQKSITPQLRDLGTSNGEFFFITARRLEEGSDDDAIRPARQTIVEAQEILSGLGYDPGPANGEVGLRTQAALRRFQIANGLPETGALDEVTIASLTGAWARRGSVVPMGVPSSVEDSLRLSERDWMDIQRALTELGFNTRGIDGRPGPNTRAAVEGWQRSQGTTATGYLTGPQLAALEAARRAPPVREPVRPTVGVFPEHQLGDRFSDCAECPQMVVVPPKPDGFMMGSPPDEEGRDDDEGPQHRVTIAEPFAIGVYEVTFDEWDACVAAGGCNGYRPDDVGWGRGGRPVINVSWDDAQAYAAWLSGETGEAYRLPSEAEWEYAARAGTTTPFHFGSTISPDQANYNGNYTYGSGREGVYRQQTVPVGSFPANAFGLHDVHGNVWEWVEDCWNDSYARVGRPDDGTAWTSGYCDAQVLRGGSWIDSPRNLRSATRSRNAVVSRDYFLGFRVARTLR